MNNSENTTTGLKFPEVDMSQLVLEVEEIKVQILNCEKVLRSLKLKLATWEFVKQYSYLFSKRPESGENDKQ
jgi:hypothetical protein